MPMNGASDTRPAASGRLGWLVLAVQSIFGAWFLFHGVNYFHEFFRQPPGTTGPSHELISTLIDTGLFACIKVLEIIIGVLLLAHWFVPLAIVAATPITLVIIYSNLILKHDAFGFSVGAGCLIANLILGLGYLRYYRPLLVFKAAAPTLDLSRAPQV